MSKVLITTVPFADKNILPLEILKQNNIEFLINPENAYMTGVGIDVCGGQYLNG